MRESKLWFWHIIAGVVILVFLGLHMFIMHLGAILGALGIGAAEPTAAKAVFERSQEAFFMLTYIVLLGAALYHGLYGFRTMLFELSLSKGLQKTINRVFATAGLALFVYGSYAAVALFMMKGVTQ
jgi:succinate dehydrogenase / fumarate reductase membrane anchor subunit